MTILGIQMKRTEHPGQDRIDKCYTGKCAALRDSCFDSESGGEEESLPVGAARAGGVRDPPATGIPLLYDGEPLTLSQHESLWIPVVLARSVGDQQVGS